MKLIFAGTPDFAAVALEALVGAGHHIVRVLTQPDRPAGRGLKLEPSPVKRVALAHGFELDQPLTLKDVAAADSLRALNTDVMVVAAYGLILPREVLMIPPRGCLNIHASLLPRWRGAAPIQRALLVGDPETGVTIMQMNEGLDTGDMLLRQSTPITDEDTTGSLHDRLAEMGARLIVKALSSPPGTPEAQDNSLATYAAKITKSEARIDWAKSACNIDRQIRAFNPAPGALTMHNSIPIKIWRARVITNFADIANANANTAAPGTRLDAGADRLVVTTGEGVLEILELQRAGAKRLSAAAFLAGSSIKPGARFDALDAASGKTA